MKKLFLFCSLLLLLSCSDDSNSSSNSDFHPPSWIQGSWAQKDSSGAAVVVFSFSSNDFCLTNSGITKQCQQEFVNQMRQVNNKATVTETITDTNYTAEIKYYAGQSIIYSFRKLSNKSIEWTSVSGSVFEKQ